MAELLDGVELINQEGKRVKAEEHLKGKLVGLYFSAGWCGPCRMFTPKLKRFYEKIVGEDNKDFEVVFVSRDREEEDLLEYFNEKQGEWVTIPFGDQKIKELLDKYEVQTIPALRVIKSNGEIVVNDARTEVQEKGQEDPEALFEEWEAFSMCNMSDVIQNFLAGGVGGACTVVVGHPFDTIKVRLQTMPRPAPGQKPLFAGAFDCARQTVVKEGVFALYKGMAAPLVGVTPLFAVFFGGCAVGKWLQQKNPEDELTFVQNMNSGALAGVFTTIIMVPGERIKCLLQVQQSGHSPSGVQYKGPLDVVKKLWKQGGIASIYRGTGATLLRDIPASAAYLSVYEYLKKAFSGEHGEGKNKKLSPGATLMAGGLAGIANWSVCIPADVLKSRLQTAPEGKYPDGIRGVLREVLREEGPKGLFKGLTPILLRAFPANAACFFGLELTLSLFRLFG
ncbi:unnamed protein product, partial [Mesorhabditis belari]|uniref:Thioredoxin domain-containing protein n=1 Tax=Mesorhabditis belari TaxID=2138241 RepID=A0AAF3FC66_9BILA